MKNLIEVLKIFMKTQKKETDKDKDTTSIETGLLLYNFLLLKLFQILIKYYPQFGLCFQVEYRSYVNLITNSLEIALLYSDHYKNKQHNSDFIRRRCAGTYDDKCLYYYYNIIYDSYKVFMFILEHSKSHSFIEMKEYMTQILNGFEKIYNSFLNPEKEIDYHIFYLFMIAQILKFINKNRTFDVKYEEFYKTVFLYGDIKMRTILCLKKNIELCDQNNQNHHDDPKIMQVFYINFLVVYCIYLNELISSKQAKDTRDREFKFDEKLKIKIEDYLTINDEKAFFTKTLGPNITQAFKQENEAHKPQENLSVNSFSFEIILLKSILYYKYKKALVEINVKLTDDPKNDKEIKNYYYIYYEMENIDLLILEMIESQLRFDNMISNTCKNISLIIFNS